MFECFRSSGLASVNKCIESGPPTISQYTRDYLIGIMCSHIFIYDLILNCVSKLTGQSATCPGPDGKYTPFTGPPYATSKTTLAYVDKINFLETFDIAVYEKELNNYKDVFSPEEIKKSPSFTIRCYSNFLNLWIIRLNMITRMS